MTSIHETIEISGWLRTRPQVRYGIIPSPFGNAVVVVANGKLAALTFCDDEERGIGDLAMQWPGAAFIKDDDVAERLCKQIFKNGRIGPPDDGIVLIGTEFQTTAWKALMDIPEGMTVTYGALAHSLGRPAAVRAVASAIGRNTLAIIVPCHRVVAAGGKLGGYRWGITRKQALLAAETA